MNKHREDTRQIQWPVRASVQLLVLLLMIFVVGIAAAGIVHQIGWIVTSPEPLHDSKAQSLSDSALSLHRPDAPTPTLDRSWVTRILPFASITLEDFEPTKPWYVPPNANWARGVSSALVCPSQGNPIRSPDGFGLAHVSGNPKLFESKKPVRLGDLANGSSGTIMIGEVNAGFAPWARPNSDRPISLGIRADWSGGQRSDIGYGSTHPEVCQFVMADGSIQIIDVDADPELLEELGN